MLVRTCDRVILPLTCRPLGFKSWFVKKIKIKKKKVICGLSMSKCSSVLFLAANRMKYLSELEINS